MILGGCKQCWRHQGLVIIALTTNSSSVKMSLHAARRLGVLHRANTGQFSISCVSAPAPKRSFLVLSFLRQSQHMMPRQLSRRPLPHTHPRLKAEHEGQDHSAPELLEHVRTPAAPAVADQVLGDQEPAQAADHHVDDRPVLVVPEGSVRLTDMPQHRMS